MKTTLITIAMVAVLATSGWATDDKKANQLASTNKEQILSPELELLFKEDRLNEAIVKPIYTAAEQIIFSEQVKLLKAKEIKPKS